MLISFKEPMTMPVAVPVILLSVLSSALLVAQDSAPVDLAGAPPTAPSGSTWTVMPELSDEFNGEALDTAKWMPKHAYWAGRDPSRFDPANVAVADGQLRLRSTTTRTSLEGLADPHKDVWVQAACISSLKAFAGPGFYAARLKASRLFMTSSFWLQGKYSEIDVVEQFGFNDSRPQRPLQMLMCTHFFPNGWKADLAVGKEWTMPTGAADEFHVYAVWWKDATTVWYYHNGVKIAEMTPGGAFNEPMYLFFDTEVFPWQGLPTIDALKDPARNTMQVDWVRSWKLTPVVTSP